MFSEISPYRPPSGSAIDGLLREMVSWNSTVQMSPQQGRTTVFPARHTLYCTLSQDYSETVILSTINQSINQTNERTNNQSFNHLCFHFHLK